MKLPEVFYHRFDIRDPGNTLKIPRIRKKVLKDIIEELNEILLKKYGFNARIEFVDKNLGYTTYSLDNRSIVVRIPSSGVSNYRVLGAFLHEIGHALYSMGERGVCSMYKYNKEYCVNAIAVSLIGKLKRHKCKALKAFEAYVANALSTIYRRLKLEMQIFYSGTIPNHINERDLSMLSRYPFVLLSMYRGFSLILEEIRDRRQYYCQGRRT